MATVRIVITLKPGVLDAQGQAVHRGLRALGYETISGVRAGKCIEITVPDQTARDDIDAMCERVLANPLIEAWRIERDQDRDWTGRSRVPVLPRCQGPRADAVSSSFL